MKLCVIQFEMLNSYIIWPGILINTMNSGALSIPGICFCTESHVHHKSVDIKLTEIYTEI